MTVLGIVVLCLIGSPILAIAAFVILALVGSSNGSRMHEAMQARGEMPKGNG